ncbi:hypothetical protein [Muriicola soli]|uniref:Prenyltransferase n=1 Tax=Muriicola soli TaxID=2507538 RepID=A0A411EBI6_9FLAO|nr:hypothetical protein [Muriicola soli]QBA64894.1 hypothetical protein EQY75_10340 [Muriicola soli]
MKASIHVSLAVVSFLYLTSCFLNIYIPKSLFFYVFFSTIPAYNFIKQSQKGENQFLRLVLVDKKTLWLSLFSLGCAIYFGLQLGFNTLLGISILALLVIFYTIPLFPSRKNLRHFGILKILIIGLVWTGTTVVLPVLEVLENLDWDVWIESVQRFLVILVLMVPFEIRDLSVDSNEMMTIPQRLGIDKTRRAGILMSLIFLLLTFLKDDLFPFEVYGKALIATSLVALMLRLPKKQSRYFASFWVEALPIFWAGLLYLFIELL